MTRAIRKHSRLWLGGLVALTLAASVLTPWSASAQELPTSPPWNGQPISPGLGPTYGEQWCDGPAPGTSIANQQSAPLALIPQEAVGCTLGKIEQEGAAKGLPDRMERFVIGTSAGGREIHAAIINALETPQQVRDYERWQQIREIELENPAGAQALLASFGADVKMPVFVQANIHGNEEEGADAIMQVIRDLVTTPRGQSAVVDSILDHVILIIIPSENPDGRFAGTRANGNSFDMNRDWLVQSQSEVRASVKLQREWLATAGLDLHGYVNPTLVDGLTKPHNPGIEYDIFLKWNQSRLDANTADLAGVGMPINRPVNMWNQAGAPPGHPYIAEGWDDWGPFYTQTYMAYYGVDSSTVEMCSSQAGGGNCNGRLGGKTSQYVTVYSSLRMWIANRQQMMHDQLEVFRRGVSGQPRPDCCGDPMMTARGFTEDQHNWMVDSPKAYLIPFGGGGQRSDGEANRMVRWLLDNGIQVETAQQSFTYQGVEYPKDTYIVWMNQAMRGLALTALSAGQDISNRITQLYAPPAAWSHGLLWGADVVEIPGTATFAPSSKRVDEPNKLKGELSGGSATWYAVTPRGVSDHKVVRDILRAGVAGQIAEESFSTAGGLAMPAGSVIFPVTSSSVRTKLQDAAKDSGLVFQPGTGGLPATTSMAEVPRVAILVNSASPSPSDTSETLRAIFGNDAGFVSVTAGSASLASAPEDPLLGYDVIYNTGQAWPAAGTARDRLTAFFNRGGGYIATSQSAAGFTFLSSAGLVSGSFTQGSQTAYGGIAVWKRDASSPVTGPYPAGDFLYLPSNVTYFTATPAGSVAAGRYHEDMSGPATSPNGPSPGFVAGLWRTRGTAANNAPVIVHGATTAGGRYFAMATNPFSRQDAEREWPLIAQAALWSNLTDDPVAPAAGGGEGAGFALPAGTTAGSAAVPNLAGEWEGEWRAADGRWGYLEMTLTQYGPELMGDASLPLGSCAAARETTGRLTGPEVRFTAGAATLSGTAEGGMITGTFRDPCSGRTGTFEMVKENTRAAD